MDNRKQNVGVFGIGAIGSVVAFELQKNKTLNTLSYYSRTPKKSICLIKKKKKYEITIPLQTPPI